MFFLSKTVRLTAPIQMQLSQIQKIFSEFFAGFPESTWNLKYFGKKRWVSEVICFWNYRLQKTGLLKCIESPISEHLQKLNMLKGRKHSLNLQDSIFVIFFDQAERKSAWKIQF